MSDWPQFFFNHAQFQARRAKEIQAGCNDYNIITALLKPSDEVKLHSRFLYSLLNPSGNHRQGRLLLRLFFEQLGIAEDYTLEAMQVRKEYRNIDLYLTDGDRHIIIENKLNAKDEDEQIPTYIKQVRDWSAGTASENDILVIYLSRNRPHPSPEGLGHAPAEPESGLEVTSVEGQLYLVGRADGSPVARYMNLHYERVAGKDSDLLAWIERCKEAVKHTGNLPTALALYRSAVENLNRTYKSNVMSFESFLNESAGDPQQTIEQADEIYREVPKLYASWINAAMMQGIEDLEGLSDATELTRYNCPAIEAYCYRPGPDAGRYFGEKSARKSKGRFWVAVPPLLSQAGNKTVSPLDSLSARSTCTWAPLPLISSKASTPWLLEKPAG
jgi:hypothetical protein